MILRKTSMFIICCQLFARNSHQSRKCPNSKFSKENLFSYNLILPSINLFNMPQPSRPKKFSHVTFPKVIQGFTILLTIIPMGQLIQLKCIIKKLYLQETMHKWTERYSCYFYDHKTKTRIKKLPSVLVTIALFLSRTFC